MTMCKRLAILTLFVLFAAPGARGDLVTLMPDRDNTLYESPTGALSNGAGQHMFTGRTSQLTNQLRRALIRFNIAGNVPPGATIDSVFLTLRMSKTPLGAGSRVTTLNKVSVDWGEGASNAPLNEGGGAAAMPGDATWDHTFFNTTFWTTDGGDFSPFSSASLLVGGVGFYTWGSTAAMVVDVQGWLDSPSTNYGWIVRGDESVGGTAKRFDTREMAAMVNRPSLDVYFSTVPYPPVLDPIGPQEVNEGQNINFTVTASDLNGTTPSLSAEDLPSGASFDDNLDGTGAFDFTPDFTQAGLFNVRFIASDGDSADTEIVAVTVAEVTDPPVARDSAHTTAEETPLATQLPASDPDTDPLVYTITGEPFNGAISELDSVTGDYTYTPSLDYNGVDSLTFSVNDGNATSNEATVRLTVTAINDPPVAGDIEVGVAENTSENVPAMPVIDVDDVSWTVTQTVGPFNGTVSGFDPSSGSFTYDPDLDYTGPDSIKYIANDGSADSDTGTVRITVVAGCLCPAQGDIAPIASIGDGVVNVLDVVAAIDEVFRSGPATAQDASCPAPRLDIAPVSAGVECGDGVKNVLDVVGIIDHVFRSGPAPCDPCNP